MGDSFHLLRVYREVEYLFSDDELSIYPQLSRLLHKGYNFIVLQRLRHPRVPLTRTFVLACDLICSNGTELLHRHEILTAEFHTLADLEHYIHNNMLDVLQKHFFGDSKASAS